MLCGIGWANVFNNPENKKDLITLVCSYFQKDEGRNLFEIPLIVNSGENTRRINPLSANPTKWSNTLKQFVGKLPTNCLSVFGHFVGLALRGLGNKRLNSS